MVAARDGRRTDHGFVVEAPHAVIPLVGTTEVILREEGLELFQGFEVTEGQHVAGLNAVANIPKRRPDTESVFARRGAQLVPTGGLNARDHLLSQPELFAE